MYSTNRFLKLPCRRSPPDAGGVAGGLYSRERRTPSSPPSTLTRCVCVCCFKGSCLGCTGCVFACRAGTASFFPSGAFSFWLPPVP